MRIALAATLVAAMGSRALADDAAVKVTDSTLRYEGAIGGSFVSEPLAGGSLGGGGIGGSAGVRTHRWGALVDWRLEAIEWTPPDQASSQAYSSAGIGAMTSKYGVGGHEQVLGFAGRFNLLSLGESAPDGMMHEFFELFVEAGADVEMIGWHDGGSLARGQGRIGGGVKMYGMRIHHDLTVGLFARVDETFSRRDDGIADVSTCAGPCDSATKPSSFDIGVAGLISIVLTN